MMVACSDDGAKEADAADGSETPDGDVQVEVSDGDAADGGDSGDGGDGGDVGDGGDAGDGDGEVPDGDVGDVQDGDDGNDGDDGDAGDGEVADGDAGDGDGEVPDGEVPDGDGGDGDAGDAGDTVEPLPSSWTLTVLGPVDGKVFSAPLSVAADGTVTGYIANEALGPDALPIVVSPTGVVTVLPVDRVQSGFAFGLSGAGLVVGSNAFQATAWVGGVEKQLTIPQGWFSGSAQAVNAGGLIVGSFGDSDDTQEPPIGARPCAWTAHTERCVQMRVPGDDVGTAYDVNDDGVVVGAGDTGDGFRPLIWETWDTNPVALSGPEGVALIEGLAINERGDVVGRAQVDGGQRGFRKLSGADVEVLGLLVATENASEASDLDDAGRVVGTSRFEPGVLHAVLWDEDGVVVDLNERVGTLPSNVKYLQRAAGISATGLRIAVEVVMDEGFGDSVRRIGILVPTGAVR